MNNHRLVIANHIKNLYAEGKQDMKQIRLLKKQNPTGSRIG